MATLVPFACSHSANLFPTAGQTSYWPHANAVAVALGLTEASVKLPYRTAGTFSYLAFTVTSDRSAINVNIRLDSGGGSANGNQTITTGASPSGAFADTTHTDTISAGTKVNSQFVNGTGGTSTTFGEIGGCFAATGTTTVKLSAYWDMSGLTGTRYWPVMGLLSSATTEAIALPQVKPTMDGVLSDLFLRLLTNAKAVTTTVRSRVGGADGNQVLTIGSSATGDFEDTTHTDTVTTGTLVNISIVTTSTSNWTGTLGGMEHTVTSGRGWVVMGANNANSTSSNTISPGGTAQPVTNTYGNAIPNGSTANSYQNLQCYLNTIAPSSGTVTLQLNASNTSLQVSVASSAAVGLYSDTTHTATPANAAHIIALLPNSGSALNWWWHSYETGGPSDSVTTTVTGTQATETDSSTSGSVGVTGAVYPAAGDRVLALKTATSDSWYGFLT